MPRVGRLVGVCLCALSVIVGSCGGDPPDKELQQAQAALAAARVAGAERYAREELVAADQALSRGREAVTQRDYRLALSSALDSREHALSAARDAAEGMAKARSDANKALAEATALLSTAGDQLKAPGQAHGPGGSVALLRRAVADADSAVQKARAAFNAGDYDRVLEAVPPSIANLRAALKASGIPRSRPAPSVSGARPKN